MHLNLLIENRDSAQPLAAYVCLSDLTAFKFNNEKLGLRHPASVYTQSLLRLVERLNGAIDAFLALNAPYDASDVDRLNKSLVRTLEDLVYSAAEHFEDCQNIAKIVVGGLPEKARDRALRDFVATIRDAREFSARQANAIKHSQGRVRLLEFNDPIRRIIGFFIEGVDADGSVGPSMAVHGNTHTAFSVGRSLRYLVASFVYLSQAIASFVRLNLKLTSPERHAGLGVLLDIFDRIADLDNSVFPDEGDTTCPAFRRTSSARSIRFPSSSTAWKRPAATARLHLVTNMDSRVPSFRLPYMGKSWGLPKGRSSKRR